MAVLPEPDAYGLPAGSVVAVPADGLTVYRLVRNDPARPEDFAPMPERRARARGVPELLRLGVSAYLAPKQAEAVLLDERSRVARIQLRPGAGVHVARTGRTFGHVTVWGPLEELVGSADLET